MTALLDVSDLTVLAHDGRTVVADAALRLDAGASLGIVGESGSGKTTTLRAVLGLLPPGLVMAAGSVVFEGDDIASWTSRQLRPLRGKRIGVVWQDPLTALDPVMRVGEQIAEVVRAHEPVSRAAAAQRARQVMRRVDLPDVDRLAHAYPHQLSGGQRQRVVIAWAVAASPVLLIADEPTSALDVTVQSRVLALLADLRRDLGLALLLVSHDLAVVAQTCERVAVMYGGRFIEQGRCIDVLSRPEHPYTAGLLGSVPDVARVGHRPLGIPGQPPTRVASAACSYAPRCPRADERCRRELPLLRQSGTSMVACHHPLGGAS